MIKHPKDRTGYVEGVNRVLFNPSGENVYDVRGEGEQPAYEYKDVIIEVAAGNRDGMQTASNVEIATAYVFVGKHNIGSVYRSCFQFKLDGVSQGAHIASARLRLFLANFSNIATAIIYGEDTDNAAVLAAVNDNITDRTSTTASINWTSPGPPADWYNTPDIAAVVQEVVNRGAWSAGNYISILVYDNGSAVGDWIQIATYENASDWTAQLLITYG